MDVTKDFELPRFPEYKRKEIPTPPPLETRAEANLQGKKNNRV